MLQMASADCELGPRSSATRGMLRGSAACAWSASTDGVEANSISDPALNLRDGLRRDPLAPSSVCCSPEDRYVLEA